MRRNGKIFGHLLVLAALIIALAAIVMFLWNWLMPYIFGLTTLTLFQALGLLILSLILFGGFFKCFRSGMWKKERNFMFEKWQKMTPEEQKDFIRKRHLHHWNEYGFFGKEESENKNPNV